ncbi:MAG: hypothetical protein MK185_16325 [Saccharospirillaceae bacterium]|jgi:hypothetical protein|nr:hypothetical protein [Saccharospirillaceae bacterium]
MANEFGDSYGLTCLCPIMNGQADPLADGIVDLASYDKITRRRIQTLPLNEHSPFAQVPNTYFARLFILNDVFFQQGDNIKRDHLKSKYLVFTSNFHGKLESYLAGMWNSSEQDIRNIWQYAVGFDKVNDATSFTEYIKKCQLTTTLFFNGSTDKSLKQQLKSLYLKQAFSEFVLLNQGKNATDLKAELTQFMQKVELDNLDSPSWVPGQTQLQEEY